MSSTDKIAVIGAGSWGTALAIHTATKFNTTLWSHRKEHVETMVFDRCNQQYLPNISFPNKLTITHDLELALNEANIILIAVPSLAFKESIYKIKSITSNPAPVISATKGLDHETNGFLSDTFLSFFPNTPFAVLSGPSFAKEVAKFMPTAIAIAANKQKTIDLFVPYFHHAAFRVYGNQDLYGVQIAGAYKNVIAISTGISDGLGFGANARSALITRGLAEISRLGIALGGELQTFMGLTGMGDLILTATDNQSRNRRFGLLLGEGYTQHDAFEKIGQVVEGANIVKNIYNLSKQHKIDTPIANQVYKILHENVLPMTSLELLLAREQKSE